GIRDFHVTGVQTCALPIWADELKMQVDPKTAPVPSSKVTCRYPTVGRLGTLSVSVTSTDPERFSRYQSSSPFEIAPVRCAPSSKVFACCWLLLGSVSIPLPTPIDRTVRETGTERLPTPVPDPTTVRV